MFKKKLRAKLAVAARCVEFEKHKRCRRVACLFVYESTNSKKLFSKANFN